MLLTWHELREPVGAREMFFSIHLISDSKGEFFYFFKAGFSDNLQQQPALQLQLLARILSVINSVSLLILKENPLLQWMFFHLCVCVLSECVWRIIGNRDEIF